ncbi:YesL family protein [Brachybacterium sp. UNK5269]|uniref:YesL family protein n=1 Tax=Brachybacterium sp. UNK5269 TaxID=3408576 RepID=UPI003BAE47C7
MAAQAAAAPRVMPGLVRWHVGLGELGLRLFLLHLLWVLGTLAGAVALGLFPATAAVHTVLRRDQTDRVREEEGLAVARRPGLWTEFWAAWRAELGRANRLGAAILVGWAVLMADRWVLGALDLGPAAPWVSGVVVVLTLVLAAVSVMVWTVAAHFADPLPRLLRMTLTLLIARLPLTISVMAVLAATVWVWQTIPGLAPVFGLVLPCWAVSSLIWRSGVLPVR